MCERPASSDSAAAVTAGAPGLLEYRIYFLDGGARIRRVETLASRDDDDAIRTAWRKVGHRGLELWSPAGLVARFSPRG